MTKILLVEDDKSLREIYGVRLLAEGYDIVSAGDGEDALAMAIKEKPTLIISDVMMPKISGFDMLDILRSTTETRDIKVIMMTALSSDDQRTRGEQLGADKYLVKSQVGIEDVVRTVHEVLGDTPGASGIPAAAAAAVPQPEAAPATPASEPTPAPVAEPTPATAPVVETPDAPVVTTDATPEPAAPASDDASVSPSSTPGNEAAGPLPPQPTLSETSLPQPTAPFSSPRPTNLGERVIQPLESTLAIDPLSPEAIAQELQAAAEPVGNTQVDDAVSDTDVATPAVDPLTPATPLVADPFVTPAEPASDPASPSVTPAADPLAPVADTATPASVADPFAAPTTSTESDDQQTPGTTPSATV